MGYNYQQERPHIFTEDGVEMLMKIRANCERFINASGAVISHKAWEGVSGSSWQMLACLDYLVEKGELREVTPTDTWGQHRVFARPLS